MNNHLKTLLVWVFLFGTMFVLWKILSTAGSPKQELDQSEFYALVGTGDIGEATITGDQVGYEITGKFRQPRTAKSGQTFSHFKTYVVKDESLPAKLRDQGAVVKAKKPSDNALLSMLLMWLPMIVVFAIWIFVMRQMQSGGNKALSFGKSRAPSTRPSCRRSGRT